MDHSKFLISESETIKTALSAIDDNSNGVIVIVSDNQNVVGICTDGDIRRWLMKGGKLTDPVVKCMNRKFIHALTQTSRENVLKLLDHKIKVVPIISPDHKLVDLVFRNSYPLPRQSKIISRARAPVRISFSGGGTDLTKFYYEHGGVALNTTINIYSRALVLKRSDNKFIIFSYDLDKRIEANSLDELINKNKDSEFNLIFSLLKLIKPTYGFELYVGSEFNIGSGLGGSSAVLAAIIGCFNQFREDRWDNYEIAEIAFQAERLTLDIDGGWQDQYATVFGGFNFIEFNKDNNIVHPLRLPAEVILELEECLILCDTGILHNSGEQHRQQQKELNKDKIKENISRNKEITYRIKTYLLKGQLKNVALLLDEAWNLKRSISSNVSNSKIDEIYDLAKNNGAIGGKLLGAGGGGHFLFFSNPTEKFRLIKKLNDIGLKAKNISIDIDGLQSWNLR